MREREDGTVLRLQMAVSVEAPTHWSCSHCAYEVPDSGGFLHAWLNGHARE
jgi:hypothetical protein